MSASDSTRKRRRLINAATRSQLVALARRSSTRTAKFTRDRPSVWQPAEVRNPTAALDTHFTEETAWKFIVSRLEAGEEVEVIELNKPAGAKGYVMRIGLGPDLPKLYVKLQMGSARVFGRSFHYSNRKWEDDRS